MPLNYKGRHKVIRVKKNETMDTQINNDLKIPEFQSSTFLILLCF